MSNADAEYLRLVKKVLEDGEVRPDRTGTGTRSLFGEQLRFNLQEGFPLLTTKKVYWRGVVGELLWFIRGDTNVKSLQADGINVWNSWANENGDLGPVYGKQLRKMVGQSGKVVDQLADVVVSLKNDPSSRRHIISLWNPAEIHLMALPPCHGVVIQFYVSESEINGYRQLSCQMYQRSADLLLGVPWNIAEYALLTHMLAQVCGYAVGELILTFGDTHIYNNHVEQVKLQLARQIRPAPTLKIDPSVTDIDDFKHESFELVDYNPHPAIPAPVAV